MNPIRQMNRNPPPAITQLEEVGSTQGSRGEKYNDERLRSESSQRRSLFGGSPSNAFRTITIKAAMHINTSVRIRVKEVELENKIENGLIGITNFRRFWFK